MDNNSDLNNLFLEMIIDEKEKELLKLILDTDNNKAIFERILERIKQVENDQA